METRRLFIGGLYNDIKEVDLRDCFKSFGTVSSVEIKRKTDEKGCPIKTFAYLDIKQTDTDFKRCVSLLSNSKWKGCRLKVQAAKESFLTRLERERQQQHQLDTPPTLDKCTATDTRENNSKEHRQKPQAIAETLPKAVPGTPLPGKKNWVVGKFGRVLPVVYLRRRDRKKIAKFDPSKTTHCLKRINLEDPRTTVSELTWNLDSEKVIANDGISVKLRKERKSKLREIENKHTDYGTNTGAFHENDVEKHRKKSSARILENNDVTSPSTKRPASDGSDLDSDSSDAYSESDVSNCSYTKLNKSSSKKTETNMTDVPDRSASPCNVPHSQNTITICSLPKKNSDSVVLDTVSQREMNTLSNGNGLQSSSRSNMQASKNDSHDEALPNSGVLKTGEDIEDLSDETSSTASERQSSNNSDEMSDSNSSTSDSDSSENEDKLSDNNSSEGESATKVCSENEDKKCNMDGGPRESKQSLHIDSEGVLVQSSKVKGQLKVSDDTPKKKLSNDKRLDALEGKKKSVQAQKNAIKDALKDLDSSVQSHDGKKHIIFGDDDEDGNDGTVMKKAAYSLGEKISGSKASSWLGLESDSDEDYAQMSDGGDEENDQLVTVKPYFEGKAGEELFKLQRRFGGDKRFELDSRFLESEEDDDSDDDDNDDDDDASVRTGKVGGKESLPKHYNKDVSTQEEGDINGNLEHEKEMAMKVLGNILGRDFRTEFSGRESQEKFPEFRSSTAVHYDPDREDHKQFEQTNAEEKEKERYEPAFDPDKRPEDPVLPEVSQDKYYDANTSSLAELFGNKKQGESSFTFLAQEPEDDVDSTAAKVRPMASAEQILKNPWQTSQLPYDSSDDNDDDDDNMVLDNAVGNGDPSNKSASQLDELFFFHPDDPELTNRINDKDAPFMRTGSQEDVTEYWVSVRSDLTQDYKRKRKDAVRRQNKLAAKRTRHR